MNEGGSNAINVLTQPYPVTNYKVRSYDNLFIRVNSFDGNTVDYFNSNDLTGGITVNPASMYISSYMVDESGFIELPLLGRVKVAGLTTREIKDMLDEKLRPEGKFVSTTVKMANFKVSVLGEVANPGMVYLYDSKTTLFQALANAGDLTNFANRERIRIIRETDKGPRTQVINLKKADVLSSEFYFLLPNDVIYVEPVKAKASNVNVQTLSLVVAAGSVAALIANVIVNASK